MTICLVSVILPSQSLRISKWSSSVFTTGFGWRSTSDTWNSHKGLIYSIQRGIGVFREEPELDTLMCYFPSFHYLRPLQSLRILPGSHMAVLWSEEIWGLPNWPPLKAKRHSVPEFTGTSCLTAPQGEEEKEWDSAAILFGESVAVCLWDSYLLFLFFVLLLEKQGNGICLPGFGEEWIRQRANNV